MASLNISLSSEMRAFIDEQVRGGSYHDHSEYVRDLIRHDRARQEKARVDALLLDGLESGEPVLLTRDDWQEIRDHVLRRAAQRADSDE